MTRKVKTKETCILLIEDNKLDIELTHAAFLEIELDHVVRTANSGKKAIDYINGVGEFQDRKKFPLPDLIFLDLKLPDMTGNDVLKAIKKIPGIRRIPIVVLTSSREQRDLIECYDNYVNSYLVKPVSFEGFLKVIKKVVEYWLLMNVLPVIESS